MSFTLSEDIAAFCIVCTLIAGFNLILPQLNAWGKVYYLYLMCWSVPYAIGYVCDVQKLGPLWVRWHLLDMSYVQWAVTLGVTIYIVAARFMDWPSTQRAIIVTSGVSLAAFIMMAYGWETAQVVEAWQKYGRTDWSDDIYYTIGLAISATPFIALRRFLASSAQAV